jgi:DNA-binding beta-propeller fold protein YncE
VTSGWSNQGIDIYKLGAGAPTFDRTVRTLGWWPGSLARSGDTAYIASGYWGVQKIDLGQ